MAEVTGVLESVSHHGPNGQFHMMHLSGDDRSFGCGRDNPEHKVGNGSVIKFDVTKNDKGYWQADTRSITVVSTQPAGAPAPTTVPTATKTVTKDQYWRNKELNDQGKDKVIQLQSCRNSAIALVQLLLSEGAITFPKAKAKTYDAILAEVENQTQAFWSDNTDMRSGDSRFVANVGNNSASDTGEAVAKPGAEDSEEW